MDNSQRIVIAGSGLVGSLLGLRLLQRGFDVSIYESRNDLRKEQMSAGRSINLALSHRGIAALKRVGIDQDILIHAIQMKGRMIHSLSGELKFQEYSSRSGEHINSISRKTLNEVLMDAIEKIKPNAILFKTKLISQEDHFQKYVFQTSDNTFITEENCILIGTDGASSVARKLLYDFTPHIRFNYSQVFQNYGYKELTIPPGENNTFVIEKNALHIWPRGHFMMIALPNPDATYTATLFLPYKGSDGFESLSSVDSLNRFFKTHFPDAIQWIPELHTEFFENPTGHLYTVKCEPWHYDGRILLMGDAAHALIPFYGQGMNCGFEDVLVFDDMLNEYSDWHQLFENFSSIRKPDADAIADLAEDNFIEMRDKVADPIFQRKRQLELQLEKLFPEYYSKYAMVTFRPDIRYRDAMIQGRKQDMLLSKICLEDKITWSESELRTIYDTLQSDFASDKIIFQH
jgi:kynurenine 3-monooxygenase